MSTGTLIPFVPQAFYDANGDPVSGGKLYAYAAGTSTPQATYNNVDLDPSHLNDNPIILDAAGRPDSGYIFLSATSYKFVLTDADDVEIWTVDNVSAIPQTNVSLDVPGTAGEAIAAGDVVYLAADGSWYKADADAAATSSLAKYVGMAPSAVASGATGSFRIQGRVTGLSALTVGTTYYVSATAGALTATPPTNTRLIGTADTTTSLLIAPNPATALVDPSIVAGRLTLTTGTPVTTGDVSAATTLYFTPYKGNQIALYDGSLWQRYAFTERSITLAGLTASRPYDVFLYDNAGTLTLDLTAWTNTTTRATALATQDGVLVKTGALTRRYLGTIYINASGGQTDDTLAKRYVWNYYNRVTRALRRIETTGTWTYTTATIRQANGSTANQVDLVIGVAEVPLQLSLLALSSNSNADISRAAGIGEDSTTTMMTTQTGVGAGAIGGTIAANSERVHTSTLNAFPAIGRHFYSWNEISTATGTTTWGGAVALSNANSIQAGLTGSIDG